MKWKEGNFLKIAVLILVVLNISLLASLWFGQNKKGIRVPPDRMSIEVGFSEKQIREFEQLRISHHRENFEIKKEITELRKKFFALLKSENAEEFEILKTRIGELQEIELERLYHHFKEVRAICNTDEQKEIFDSVIGRSIPGQNGGPPSHPKGPERGNRPPPH